MVATWNIAADDGYYAREATGDLRRSYYSGTNEFACKNYAPGGDFNLVDGSEVDFEQFRRLYAGIGVDGKSLFSSLPGRSARRVPAYDITVSAPRSISLIWTYSSPEMREAIEKAIERSARAALVIMEREASFARRGHGGERLERIRLSGAIFQHCESRPAQHTDGEIFADPNLHLHCVLYNMATRFDGTVGAVYSVAQRNFKMCFGAISHAVLASEMQALGFKVDRIGANGTFEIAGVLDEIISYFSARGNEIKRILEGYDVSSKEAYALASAVAKATRGAKNGASSARREEIWLDAGKRRGIDVSNFSENFRNPQYILSADAAEALFNARLAKLPQLLTKTKSVFGRTDLLQAVAVAMVGTSLPISQLDVGVHELIGSGAIVELGRDKVGNPRYSTAEIIQIEREIVASVGHLAAADGFALDADEMCAACAEQGLSAEQTDAVLTSTNCSAVAIISGAPGSGKTTSLTPIVRAYSAAGFRVIGASSAWRIATALRTDLSIPSRALASWLERARRGREFLKSRDVLIIDEAGLVGTREMHAIVTQAARVGAKVILVGDTQQLQPIGGPGLHLVQETIQSARVQTIVRQNEQWERDAIVAFGRGQAEDAIRAYEAHGRVVETQGPIAAVDAVVAQWARFRREDRPLLLARTNAAVRAVSRGVRNVLRSEGYITGPEVTVATVTASGQATSIDLSKGDRIRFLSRSDALGVINGTVGKVVNVTLAAADDQPSNKSIEIQAEIEGRLVSFSPDDIADGRGRARIGWAYATTIHQSQGMTVDNAVVLVDPNFDRHQIYVASSRARATTTLVIDGGSIDHRLAAELPFDQQNRETTFTREHRANWLAKRLSQSHVQETTADVLISAQIATAPPGDAGSEHFRPLETRTHNRSRERSLG